MLLTSGALVSLALLVSTASVDNQRLDSVTQIPNVTSQVRNANHIFNSLHSSMRQWGSAWNHNGMSFFLASVPAGTQFYHGTASATRVNGTEWLAFEPEHALIFARPSQPLSYMGRKRDTGPQKVLDDAADDDKKRDNWGYLHTYSTNKELRLLYLDGLSAGKTNMGTLDLGDRVFLGDNVTRPVGMIDFPEYSDDDVRKLHDQQPGPDVDYTRAWRGCEIAKNSWDDRVHGVLRAQAGFEVILCDFARDLDLVRISAVHPEESSRGGFGVNPNFYRSIASRYDGIGGGRVRINYDNFITAYTYEELDLFNGGENRMPRLDHFSGEELGSIRNDLTRFVMEHETTEISLNWQSVIDMIVAKYSNFLRYLISGEIESLEGLQSNITSVYTVFIDECQRNATAESERCAMQFIPARNSKGNTKSSLAGRVVYDVSYSICSSLRSAIDDTDFSVARSRIENLMTYLSWTTWKECKDRCGYNQACYIPIWPFGTTQDRLNPRCKDGVEDGDDSEEYWKSGFENSGDKSPLIHKDFI